MDCVGLRIGELFRDGALPLKILDATHHDIKPQVTIYGKNSIRYIFTKNILTIRYLDVVRTPYGALVSSRSSLHFAKKASMKKKTSRIVCTDVLDVHVHTVQDSIPAVL